MFSKLLDKIQINNIDEIQLNKQSTTHEISWLHAMDENYYTVFQCTLKKTFLGNLLEYKWGVHELIVEILMHPSSYVEISRHR